METAVKLLHKGVIQTAAADGGKEFNGCNVLEKELGIQVYFADAYSS
ncbi:hypothetical protein [Bacillus xiapuensis]|nr:hypothetical protein [Bacillus xiapuensis]